MVLEESVLSWRTNSRPSPRFAPVITKIGIANCRGLLSDLGLFDVGAMKVLSLVNGNVGRINSNLIQLKNLACEWRNCLRDRILYALQTSFPEGENSLALRKNDDVLPPLFPGPSLVTAIY
jgi:hypothetical protein